MIHKVWNYCCGELLIIGTGGETERFINLSHNHEILLWNVSWAGDNRVRFCVRLKDFYRLKPCIRKTGIRLKIQERRGIPFVIGAMKKRKSFFGGLFLCMMLVTFLSSRVWGIEIVGGHVHTKEEMIKQLDRLGVYGGVAMQSVHCGKIEEKIRNKNTDIGWVSIEKRGCVFRMCLKEMQNITVTGKERNGHLIADDSGIVTSIVTRKGTPKVKKGKHVKKGQILIAGAVSVRGDDASLLSKKYVHADGDVVLEQEIKYQDTLPKNYKKKEYTGKKRKMIEIHLGKQKFFLYNPLKYLESSGKCDIIREGGQVGSSISLRSPLWIYTTECREIEYHADTYSKKDAKAILERRFYHYITSLKESDCICKETHITFSDTGDAYCLSGTLTLLKKQSTYRLINKKDITVTSGKERNKN